MTDVLLDGIKDVLPLTSRRELVSRWFKLQRELQRGICQTLRESHGNWRYVISIDKDRELFELIQSLRKIKDFFEYVPLEHDQTSITLDAAKYAMLSDFIDQEIAWHNTVISSIAIENQSGLSSAIESCRNWIVVLFIICLVYMLFKYIM
ncbi:MAG: hypothetical protein JW745_00020 [Sedimentisphaerales bacterium]|nr:hypothetical protein [Sedimentisphaerales bacterium]MBN2841814.1 hypothetical protein [Sedimentisphaerales bacterium]